MDVAHVGAWMGMMPAPCAYKVHEELGGNEPSLDSHELFVTVALMPRDRACLAARATGGRLGADYGSVGAALGNIIGTVAPSTVSDDEICVDILPDVVDATRREVRRLGWDCHVAPVSLPPVAGETDWRKCMALPNGVIVVVFRVALVKPASLPNQSMATKLHQLTVGCCSLRPPLFYNSAKGVELESGIQIALRTRLNQAIAEVRAIGATQLYEALHKEGSSQALCAQAIEQARRSMAPRSMGHA